jgi:hypothetical protein
MDKMILVAIGVGFLIVAAVDQREDAASVPATSVSHAPASPVASFASVGTTSEAAVVAPVLATPPPPVNPIPRAAELGGKVIDDRFQPDG